MMKSKLHIITEYFYLSLLWLMVAFTMSIILHVILYILGIIK